MTRVLLVSPTSVPGGAERVLAGLAARLPDFGLEPHAVLLEEGPLEDWLHRAGCPTEVVAAGRTRHVARTVRVMAHLRRVALREQVDVILSNQSKGHFYGGLAAFGARRPAVWWQHGIPAPGRIERAAGLVPAAAVVCVSSRAAYTQARMTPRRRIQMIHPGIALERITARRGSGNAVRQKLGWDGPVVGIVGRLQPWKGQDVFLRTASIVAEAEPRVRFAVVGGAVLGWEGSYPDDLRRLAAGLGIAEKVHFAGHRDDVIPWLDALDIVVHASFGEPFGLVLLEAMALGKPLVAAADGGPLDIVSDEVSGLLVSPGDPERLADSVLRLLRDSHLADALSVGARARVEQFSEERMAASFAELLSDIAGGASSSELAKWPLLQSGAD